MRNGIQLIQDVIQRNYSGSSVRVTDGYGHDRPTKVLQFDIPAFGSPKLKCIFSYWKLDWRDWVVEWEVMRSETPGKKSYVRVSIFVKASLADVMESDVDVGKIAVRIGNQLDQMKVYTLEDANKLLFGCDTPVVYEHEARGLIIKLEEQISDLLGCGTYWKNCANFKTEQCRKECGGNPPRHFKPIVNGRAT